VAESFTVGDGTKEGKKVKALNVGVTQEFLCTYYII
jgi:hypothetical protein